MDARSICNSSPTEILGWLLNQVGIRAGLSPSGAVLGRLEAMVKKLDAAELSSLVMELASPISGESRWHGLLESLLVHETYFMRDPEQIDALRYGALPEIIAHAKESATPTLRMWSAACSSGEEAFSLAFLALDALADANEVTFDASGEICFHARKWKIHILATDLSRKMLRNAAAATYPSLDLGAFRSLPERHWKHFDRKETGASEQQAWVVKSNIQNLVHFSVFNLHQPHPPETGFDLVLCRNVLIYFDNEAKKNVFQMIHAATRNNGFAAFGPTDIPNPPSLFVPIWGPKSVFYKKVSGKP